MTLEESIEKSKYILELKDDWDDEGSPAYNKEVYDKCIDWVVNYFKRADLVPDIYHGPEGGIDVLAENDKYRLFFYLHPNKECSFYKDYKTDKNIFEHGYFDFIYTNLTYLL